LAPIPTDRPIVPGVPLVGADLLRSASYFARRLAPEHLRPDAASAFVLSALEAAPRARAVETSKAFVLHAGLHGLFKFLRTERARVRQAASLDAERGTAEDPCALLETIPDPRTRRPDHEAIAREEAAAVRAAVELLPSRERKIAVEILVEGRPVPAVAAEAGQSRQTVYLWLARAERRLRRRLAACAP